MVQAGPEVGAPPTDTDSPPTSFPQRGTDGSPPSGQPAPAMASAPEVEAETPPEGEPAGEEGTAEAPEGEGGPEAPPWSQAQDVDGVLATEPVAEAVEEQVETARKGALTEALDQMRPAIQRREEILKRVDGGLSRVANSLTKAVRAGTLSRDDLSELAEDNREMFEALRGYQLEYGVWEGTQTVARHMAKGLGNESSFVDRLRHMSEGYKDDAFWTDLREAMADEATKKVREELKKANATIVRLETEAKTAARQETPPPARTTGRAAGSISVEQENKELVDPATPMSRVREIMARRRGVA